MIKINGLPVSCHLKEGPGGFNLPGLMKYPLPQAYHLPVSAVADFLVTDVERGLTEAEAAKRLAQFGENILETKRQIPWWQILLLQFISPLAWVLGIAGGLAFFFGEWLEGVAILLVLLINALIGFGMELQANRSMNALRQLSKTNAHVIRDGALRQIKAAGLVPGDMVVLEAGDVVPADGRIIVGRNLEAREAALTGESAPVEKEDKSAHPKAVLGDRRCMVYKGTIISKGNAKVLITATGKLTELGRIAKMAGEATKESTPLEKKLARLSRKLLWLTLALTLLILLIGILEGRELYLMIKTAIPLAVAAIPEGLPIVATIALARGMLRLAQRQVIVKKLSAVETLGETQIIFTDKTGTLTENRLSVDTLVFDFGKDSLQFGKDKIFFKNPANNWFSETYAFEQLLRISVLCNNANLRDGDGSEHLGDPLEVALLEMVRSSGWNPDQLRHEFPRQKEIPFDSETKMMGTLHRNGKQPDYLVCIKGAVEVILPESDFVLTRDGKRPFREAEEWLQKAEELGAKGLRTLAIAYSEINQPEDEFFHNLVLVGITAFLDPPRKDVPAAIQQCRQAGIKVIMVTGDHPETARNIALKTGLAEEGEVIVMPGKNLRPLVELEPGEIDNILKANVFARVSPAQKLDLVTIYQQHGNTVGMTGDGINDAPALKKSDIGIAMGKRGTEAAKEVADLVLEDDAFPSIVMAIRQGRGIFENIRHFIVYLLSCNLSEILVVATASFANLGLPITPLQILFLNMVTDVFPALAIGMGREAEDVMLQPPRSKREMLITRKHWAAIGIYALFIAAAVLGVIFYGKYSLRLDHVLVNNMAFYTLIFSQLWHVFNLPSARVSFFRNEITRNKYVWFALVLCMVLTLVVYQLPATAAVLSLKAFPLHLLLVVFGFSLAPVAGLQLLKRLKWFA